MSILEYNGGAVIAMTGKNCVAIACDTRYGLQNQTIATNFPKVFRMTEKCFVGLPGLATDMQTISEKLRFRVNMYRLKEERDIEPSVLAGLVSHVLYEKRFGPFFVEPVVAGLQGPKNEPYICAMDLIGATSLSQDFAVSGTCTEAMFGLAETLYKPDMDPSELFEVVSQCLLAAVDRDALSGWGGVVYILDKENLTVKHLEGRQD